MNRIDTTMDDMANTKFLTLYSSLIKNFTATTEFNHNEVVCLLIVYYKFVRMNGPTAKQMKKNQMYNLFLVLFRIYDMIIIERILLNISNDVTHISPEAWMKLFSVFLSTDLEERMQFAFKVNLWVNLGTYLSNCTPPRSIQHLPLAYWIVKLSEWLYQTIFMEMMTMRSRNYKR